jgi:hypothetical protein
MIKSDALSCPICEGKPNSNKHRCQDYYDDMLKRTSVIISKDGTIGITALPDILNVPSSVVDDIPALKEEIKLLKYELWQQRFNNEKNLSIDGVIADKIKELETQKAGLIEFINIMILIRDTEILEVKIKEYIERISK